MTATPIYDAMWARYAARRPYYVFQHADGSWDRRMLAFTHSYAFGVRSPASAIDLITVAGLMAS